MFGRIYPGDQQIDIVVGAAIREEHLVGLVGLGAGDGTGLLYGAVPHASQAETSQGETEAQQGDGGPHGNHQPVVTIENPVEFFHHLGIVS